MKQRPDILVYSPADEVQAVVEVKTKTNASEEWVRRFRRNLVEHSILPRAKFFLLVLPDNIWIWRDTQSPEEIAPDFKVPTKDVLGTYLQHWSEDFPTESTFGLVVTSWLINLAHSQLSRETAPPELDWLFDSGFYDSIRSGNVEREAAA